MAKRLESTNNSLSFEKEPETEELKYRNEMKKRDDIIMILC